jgi:hypothetical protein
MLVISGRRWLLFEEEVLRACVHAWSGLSVFERAKCGHDIQVACTPPLLHPSQYFFSRLKALKGAAFRFCLSRNSFFSETVLTLWFYFIFCNEHFCSRNIDEVHLWYRCNKVCPSLLSFLQTPKIIFKFQQLLKVIKCYQDNLHSLKHLNSPKYYLQFVLR